MNVYQATLPSTSAIKEDDLWLIFITACSKEDVIIVCQCVCCIPRSFSQDLPLYY